MIEARSPARIRSLTPFVVPACAGSGSRRPCVELDAVLGTCSWSCAYSQDVDRGKQRQDAAERHQAEQAAW